MVPKCDHLLARSATFCLAGKHMNEFKRHSVIDQTADHIRSGIATGRWKNKLPGLRPLAAEMGVGRNTLRSAIQQLVNEGMIRSGDAGDSYTIVQSSKRRTTGKPPSNSLRIGILIHGPLEKQGPQMQPIIERIINDARNHGHHAFCVAFPIDKDKHSTGYLKQLTANAKADAWLLVMATQGIIEWFLGKNIPALSIGTRGADTAIDTAMFAYEDALRDAVRRLIQLGHRRIVMIIWSGARRPTPSPLVRVFQEELANAGITPGDFHVPEWEETPQGIANLMTSLFKVTAPTALLIWPTDVTCAALSWLSAQRLRVPMDVSVFCPTQHPWFAWISPDLNVAHFDRDTNAWHLHVNRWIHKIATGKKTPHRFDKLARLVPGNSFGPVSTSSHRRIFRKS